MDKDSFNDIYSLGISRGAGADADKRRQGVRISNPVYDPSRLNS